jgi:hypothetical protein
MIFDPLYLILVGPAFLIALIAQAKVSSTFARFSKMASRSGYSGAQAARAILHGAGLELPVEPVPGRLTDHYDPRSRTLRLSETVYGSRSLAALGVAAHEAGHAIQHATGYAPMKLRTAVVPLAALGSHAWIWLFIIGLIMGSAGGVLIQAAIILFSAVVFFQIVTLPVEFNASRRAVALLTSQGIVAQDEVRAAKKVLNAAALTYVAAVLQSIMILVYMLARSRD